VDSLENLPEGSPEEQQEQILVKSQVLEQEVAPEELSAPRQEEKQGRTQEGQLEEARAERLEVLESESIPRSYW
jgi:hypothetical protein